MNLPVLIVHSLFIFLLSHFTVGHQNVRGINRESTPANHAIDDNFMPYNGERYDKFDWALMKKLVADHPQSNIILSPISIKILLLMLLEGANDNTFNELEYALQLPHNITVVRDRIKQIINSLEIQNDHYELLMSSRLFMDSHYTPVQKFAAIIEHAYHAVINKTTFMDNPEMAAKVINEWIQSSTKGHVNSLFQKEDFQNALLVLMNAIYFKGKWRYNFPSNNTYEGQFFKNGKHLVPCTYMQNTASYFYTEIPRLNTKLLRLPYQGDKFAMYVLLPNSKDGLPKLLEQLTSDTYNDILWTLDMEQKVEVTLPKIKFEMTSKLAPVLQQLGITKIFSNTANLAGIARGQNGGMGSLIVSNVLQKSGIEINEEGSTAYSVSGITLGNKFSSADYVFKAFHPFLFVIEDETTGTILYFGKVEDPTNGINEIKESMPAYSPIPPPSVVMEENSLGTSSPMKDQDDKRDTSKQPFLSPVTMPGETEIQALQRNNYFDVELFQRMCFSHSGNVLVSPLSIKSVLAMVLEGASGNTAQELQLALRLPENSDISRNYIKSLLAKIKGTGDSGVKLDTANAIFHASNITPAKTYRNILKSFYFTELYKVNFADAQKTASMINKWISDVTRGTIDGIVRPDSLDPATVMTIVNGLYFKGKWEKQFTKRDTVERCFQVAENVCEKVQMMNIADQFRYAEIADLNAKAVDIPYKGGEYGMLLVVPNQVNGIFQLIRDLPHASLLNILNMLQETEVRISLPKFKLEFYQEITPDLRELGIRQVFTRNAELTRFTDPPQPTQVSSVFHRVIMEVDEEGSKAAASSAAMIIPLITASGEQVRADHPFILFIHDTVGNVLFAGQISNPNK